MKGAQGKEKGFMIAGAICILLMMPPLFMITFSVGIIPNLILMLIFCGLGITFMLLATKERKARLNGNNTQSKPTETKQTNSVKNETAPTFKSVETASILRGEEVVIKGDVKPNNSNDDDPFEQALNKKAKSDIAEATGNGSNKKILAAIISIITILVVAAVAVIVVLSLKKNDNKNNGGSDNGGSSKATFNITTDTYYEELSGSDRVDGYLFKPNHEYIQYRFEKFDEGFFVTWIEYGTWTYTESTKIINATCTTYETYESFTDTWVTNTYSADSSNAHKKFELVSDKKIYSECNSDFVATKVSSFKYSITKYHG